MILTKTFPTFTDIEKRKSFADMKLAEVAAGGQQWNFENLPEEPSTPCDEAIDEAVDEDFMTKNGGDSFQHSPLPVQQPEVGETAAETGSETQLHCNGHETVAEQNGDKNNEAASNGTPPASRPQPPILTPASAASAAEIKKLDPVTEITPDLQVKIADLGNACWVVC